MQIQVKVIQVLQQASGTSQKGNQWVRQEFIGETLDQYPKKVCFAIFNPDSYKPVPTVGSIVNVEFSLDSRSYTDSKGTERWSTSVNVSSVSQANVSQPAAAAPQQQFATQNSQQQFNTQQAPASSEPKPASGDDDDLPF